MYPDTHNQLTTGPRSFLTTRWTVVIAAQAQGSAEAMAALESLCHTYWYPLFAFVRRQGHSPHDAEAAALAEKMTRAVAETPVPPPR